MNSSSDLAQNSFLKWSVCLCHSLLTLQSYPPPACTALHSPQTTLPAASKIPPFTSGRCLPLIGQPPEALPTPTLHQHKTMPPGTLPSVATRVLCTGRRSVPAAATLCRAVRTAVCVSGMCTGVPVLSATRGTSTQCGTWCSGGCVGRVEGGVVHCTPHLLHEQLHWWDSVLGYVCWEGREERRE